ncbi:MAG: ABC transporter ATP-binding protein [Candidatus Methanoplasma sp.]|jgi:iron complex transport system ATP-binding protein|nr:ABC transporter ATP-binding protein [Candidatus Methanoplasma sp.]
MSPFGNIRDRGAGTVEKKRGICVDLDVNGIHFSYGGSPILKGVSLKVGAGEIMGVLGPNGSGKTTFIKCINRILTPSQGEVLLDSRDASDISSGELAKMIGYVPQNASYDYTAPNVYEVVMMGRCPHSMGWQSSKADDDAVWTCLEKLDVDHLATKDFSKLSSGQSQRVLIARALAQEASVLLLDEPTSNLDVKYQLEVMDTVKGLAESEGNIVCAILHDMDTAMRYCDKVVMLENGEITAAGPTVEVLTPENIERTYGVKAAVEFIHGRCRVMIL